MSSSAVPVPQSVLGETIGAILLGGFIAAALYGITCLQCFIFLQKTGKGERVLVLTVLALWIMGTGHMALVVYTSYWYTVTNFANASVLIGLHWSIPVSLMITATGDALVRGWFAYRVWKLGRQSKLVTFPLCALIAVIWTFTMILEIKALMLTDFTEAAKLSWILYFDLSIIVFTDSYIAIFLSYYLYRSRSRFNKRIDTLLTKLILYVMNTGVATSVMSCACLISYISMPNAYIFIGIMFPLNQLYANSLLASFNARDWMRGSGDKENFVLSQTVSDRTTGRVQNPVFPSMNKDFRQGQTSSVDFPLQVEIKHETLESIA